MSFTSTASIFKRIEAALEYDLLGSTTADGTVDADVNGHLSSPINSSPVCERVERYVIAPESAGDLYAVNGRTGMTVGYSFGTQLPAGPETGTGRSLTHEMPVEITVMRVVKSLDDILQGAAGYDVDDVMDDIQTMFGAARRDCTNFGVQNVRQGNVQALEGGTPEAPWHGRILRFAFRRSHRPLEHS